MFQVQAPDPSWLIAIQRRRAVLWIGPGFSRMFERGSVISVLEDFLFRPWAAVVIDAPGLPVGEIAAESERLGSLVLRYFVDDAGPDRLPPNRLPIYDLRGSSGAVGPGYGQDPQGLLTRYTMLRRVPVQYDVFALGIGDEQGIQSLLEAQQISSAFSRLVLVGPIPSNASQLERAADSVFHWNVDLTEFSAFLQQAEIEGDIAGEQILVRNAHGLQPVDLSGTIDASYPITASFELVPAVAAVAPVQPTVDLLRSFLESPSASWDPYAADIPARRVEQYERSLLRTVERFHSDGPSASTTAWLPAEDGSGATTALRQLSLSMARRGFPVAVARPDVTRFDFVQLSAFLARASDRMADAGVSIPELPWIIAFDAEHTSLQQEFVAGLANGLKKLMRSVVVLAIRPAGRNADESRFVALGSNIRLGDTLPNTVTTEEAIRVGEHLTSFLPVEARRNRAEWQNFASDAVRTTMEGRASLFWVALRFWLFRLPGTEQSLRAWLAGKLDALVGGRGSLYSGLLEVAALSRYRLLMPAELLTPESYDELRLVARDSNNPLGFRRVTQSTTDAFAFAHPLIAEEILRISQESPQALGAVDKGACVNLLDLELHLLGRIVNRPTAGNPECISIVEELVTTGLRVDPREAPRNYEARDRIVDLLEGAPDSVWDSSQIFNHHVAKARRHLAVDVPDRTWTWQARQEQLDLAEYHLLDAMENIHPDDPERRESPLNLRVSLALTLDVRARLEAEHGESGLAEEYRRRAEESYALAQMIDADNTYVLENFARFKIHQARDAEDDSERIRLLVEAISLLQWERDVSQSGARDEPILSELGRAFDMLSHDAGKGLLTQMAEQGSESAAVALAKLTLYEDNRADLDQTLIVAETILEGVPIRASTWRSQFALYQVVSKLRPADFQKRLEILQRLDADPEFAWPLQFLIEYGILLFQAGDSTSRRAGKEVFRKVREQLADRSATVRVPPEMKFLMDPASGFLKRLLTTMVVKDVSYIGRNYYAIPQGWHNIDVPFRPMWFGEHIRAGDERDCYIQFTNFGPQAVPPTVE